MTESWVVRADMRLAADLARVKVSSGAILLLMHIEAASRVKDHCWGSNRHFAGLMGDTSERSIRRYLGELREAGAISTEYGEGGQRIKIKMLRRFDSTLPVADAPESVEDPRTNLSRGADKSVHAPRTNLSAPPGQICPHNNDELKKDKERRKTNASITSSKEKNSSEVILPGLPTEAVRSIKEHIPDLIDDLQLESRRILEAAGYDAGIIDLAAFGLRQDRFNGRPIDNPVELFVSKCRTLAESKALEGTPAPPFPDLATFQVSDGPHGADVSDLQRGWQFIWNAWHQKRLCEEFVRHHRKYPMAWWKQAIGKAATTAATINSMRYVVEIIEASHEAEHETWRGLLAGGLDGQDSATGTRS